MDSQQTSIVYLTQKETESSHMQDVLDSGKVKAIGVSELSTEDAKKIHSVVPVSAIEIEWNLFNRECEVRQILLILRLDLYEITPLMTPDLGPLNFNLILKRLADLISVKFLTELNGLCLSVGSRGNKVHTN